MESEKQHQRSDVEFLEDLVDELFLDIGLEADRLRLATVGCDDRLLGMVVLHRLGERLGPEHLGADVGVDPDQVEEG